MQIKDMGEDLECVCQIMRTVGPRLDHQKARVSLCVCVTQPLTYLSSQCVMLGTEPCVCVCVFSP